MLVFISCLVQPVQNKVPTSAQRRRPSSSIKVKQDATISEDTNDLKKEEQAQHRSTSSRTRRLAQAQEKTGNIPLQTSSNNEEENKLVMSTKEINEIGLEQDNARQKSIERSDQPMSEFAGSQEVTEMRFSSMISLLITK